MSVIRVLGVMTGTSCDGADLVTVDYSRPNSSLPTESLVGQKSFEYPNKLRAQVLKIQKGPITLSSLQDLDRDLGLWMAKCIVTTLKEESTTPDAVAIHGQTIYHNPSKPHEGTTLQVMDPARIAAATGITTLSQFRKGDVASGGQGAPLAPLYHEHLAQQHFQTSDGVAFHNLGGISNLTYIGKDETLAFDTGPANLWIDDAVRKITHGKKNYDAGGLLSLKGTPDEAAMSKLLKHRFLKKALPKSTGRDDFPFSMLEKATKKGGNDLVATATQFTILSIVAAYERYILKKGLPLETIVLCGGGAKNLTLLEGLEVCLPQVEIITSEEIGIPSQAMEARAFAYFGYLSLLGKSISGPWTLYPRQTMRPLYAPAAEILPGKNWAALIPKIAQHQASGR